MGGCYIEIHQRVRHRTDQNDRRKDRAEILDHKLEDHFSAERMTAVCDLLFDLCNSDDSRYEKAGRDRRDRHHNRVCQEIEEVKELHSDHGHTGQWTIAKTGERSEQEHNDSHKYRRLFPAPVQLILKSGDGTLGQGDGTCDSREQDQNKNRMPTAAPSPMLANTFGIVMNISAGPACRVSGSPPEKAKTAGMIMRPAMIAIAVSKISTFWVESSIEVSFSCRNRR